MQEKGFGIGLSLRAERISGSLVTLGKDLSLASCLGFEAAELPASGLDLLLGGRVLRPRLRQVKRVLAGFPELRVSLHGPEVLDLGDLEREKLHHRLAMASLEVAIELGAEVVVFHRGRSLHPAAGAAEAEALAALADVAAGQVIIGVETGDFPVFELVSLVEEVGRRGVGIVYDFGHVQIAAGRFGFDPLKALDSALPHIVHLHLHDNFGRGELVCPPAITGWPLGEGDLHLPPGWGTVPFAKAFSKLQAFQGLCILELHPRFFKPERSLEKGFPEVEEALLRVRRWRERPALLREGLVDLAIESFYSSG